MNMYISLVEGKREKIQKEEEIVEVVKSYHQF